MTEDITRDRDPTGITLKELMDDLQLQTEIHDKTALAKRREHKLREKEHKDEVKRKRKRTSRIPETEDERKLRKYRVVEPD